MAFADADGAPKKLPINTAMIAAMSARMCRGFVIELPFVKRRSSE